MDSFKLEKRFSLSSDGCLSSSSNDNPGEFTTRGAAHSGQVNSVSTCIQMPIVASAGADKMVYVWNYNTGDQICRKEFADIPVELSLHPFGKQLIVSFHDEVLLAHIVLDEFRIFWRMQINCRSCKFSTGGHRFAIAHENVILIFDIISGQKLKELKGHKSKLQSIVWIKGDSEIIASDEDKVVYRWDLSSACLVKECALYKSCPYIKLVASNQDELWVFSPGRSDSLSSTSLEVIKVMRTASIDTQEDSILLASNDSPCFGILSCSYPKDFKIIIIDENQQYIEKNIKEKTTAMALSFDNECIIVGFVGGGLEIYTLQDLRGSESLLTEGPLTSSCNSNMHSKSLLVSDLLLQERESISIDLDNTIREVEAEFQNRIVIKKFSNEEEINNFEEKLAKVRNSGSLAIGQLKDKQSRISRKSDESSQHQVSIFEAEANRIEGNFRIEMENLVESQRILSETWSAKIMQCEQDKHNLLKINQNAMSTMKDKFRESLLEQKKIIKTSKDQLCKARKEVRDIIIILEEEADIQIETAKKKYQDKLATAREKTLRVSSDSGILSKKTSSLQRTLEDQKETIKMLIGREEDMQETLKYLNDSYSKLQGNHEAKVKLKATKVATLQRLTIQAKQLKKFHYILDEKVNDLKLCLDASADSDLKKEFKNSTDEHKRLKHVNDELDCLYSSTLEKIKKQKDVLEKSKYDSTLLLKRKSLLLKWLQESLDNIQNPAALDKLLSDSVIVANKSNPDVSDAVDRSVVQDLNAKLRKIKRDLDSKQRRYESSLAHLRSENQELLNDLANKKEIVNNMQLQTTKFRDNNKF